MSKTLITWPHGSTDGEREARNLQKLYPTVSDVIDGKDLGGVTSTAYQMLIVVGHREEIKPKATLEALGKCVKKLGAKYVVMANCESGTAEHHGTLGDNELWEPAQVVANYTDAEVAATARELLFTEVGKGTAFQSSSQHGITTKEPSPSAVLWKYFKKKDEVDDLADALSKL
jgi:hypothetical protein